MTEAELIGIVSKKFGKVRRMGKGYLYFACPTCHPKDRKKCKRFLYPGLEMTDCWICGISIPTSILIGDAKFEVSKSNQKIEVKPEDPRARVLPCRKVIPINSLSHEHPAVKFLFKDHLFELDRYYKDYGIVYCPPDGGVVFNDKPYITSAERIIFPVTFDNQLVGWQMRSVPGTTFGDMPDVVRYYHIFNKGSYLYNYDKAKEYPMVILVEGIKKVLKFNNAVATLGKSISHTQMELLYKWDRLTIMLDSENGARKQAEEVAQYAKLQGKQVVNINPGDHGYDSPDEMTAEAAQIIVASAWLNR